jgi:hypothetical protein
MKQQRQSGGGAGRGDEVFGRATLLLLTLALGSLPAWWMAAVGFLGRDMDPLRWIALFAAPFLAATLLLSTVYFVSRGSEIGPAGTRSRFLLPASGGLFLVLAALLAVPALLFPELPEATLRVLERSGGSLESLKDRALIDPDPRRRLEAAWAHYLRTGYGTVFTDEAGNPVVYEPGETERRRLAAYRWLAVRPGVLPRERRLLAVADVLLIVAVLAAIPLAGILGRRHAVPVPSLNGLPGG